jgi:hypothetical protein
MRAVFKNIRGWFLNYYDKLTLQRMKISVFFRVELEAFMHYSQMVSVFKRRYFMRKFCRHAYLT